MTNPSLSPLRYQVREIARLVKGRVVAGDPTWTLTGVNSLLLAGPDELSFISSSKHFKDAQQSKAGCVIAPESYASATQTIIVSTQPKTAFVHAMWLFHPTRYAATGIHPSATIDPSATLGADVSIGPFVTIGKGVTIGDRVQLGPSVIVGDGVRIGSETLIYPNVTLYHHVAIGSRVIIHAGTVIGADGFGFVLEEGRHLKVPQLGTVVIEDEVEIGANCTIDRATFGSTVLKRGTKTDNLVHIAHNVTVGEHSLLVAQVGIAGSSKIGNYTTVAGQAGIADNATIGDYVTVAGQAGIITGQIIESGQTVWGTPARPIEEVKRRQAAMAMLPKLLDRIRDLEERLATLEQALNDSSKF